jgi:glutamine synthetase
MSERQDLNEVFGSNVFSDALMRERLPKGTYKALQKTIREGNSLDPEVAEVVANAMKDWAIEKGATHYTHWFQPLTGVTAEKHESFIMPTSDGKVILEFSSKELIKGEPDASSFPSGGLRATFEARGYTAWDCTSPAFLKEEPSGAVTLCIPTAFCSYNGEALDQKTPLLRSMEALSKQAMRILKLFGNTTSKQVITTVGPEQEYFLVDEEYYYLRRDLVYTGRTLFGAPPPKGQELEDHYFGAIKERVSAYMKELNTELWKLGVTAKTQHNEVAPSQYELAPVFASSNVATDNNQVAMETMQRVAQRHGLVCLLHEKPYAGVNGSGKHNNWSMSTDDGINLLNPGHTPHENAQFMLFLAAIISAVDDNAELLRLSCANVGNDHRLGANEAPPAIISIFLGDQLTEILNQIESGKVTGTNGGVKMKIGVTTLPDLPKDATDRNRTSPFAFTGNKFEFRMVGSSDSIASPNTTMNTIVADTLSQYADILEKSKDINASVQTIVKDMIKAHKKVIFNGDNYAPDWPAEAEKRGLPNIKNMVDIAPYMIKEKTIELFGRHGVLSDKELHSRYEVMLERYAKTINIEALTMLKIAKRQILPASIEYTSVLAGTINGIKETGMAVDMGVMKSMLADICATLTSFKENITKLEKAVAYAGEAEEDALEAATRYRDDVFTAMGELRADGDKLETLVDAKLWPLPTYGEMLFNL